MTDLAESKMAMVAPSFLDICLGKQNLSEEIFSVSCLFKKSPVGMKTVFQPSFKVLKTCLFTYPFFSSETILTRADTRTRT